MSILSLGVSDQGYCACCGRGIRPGMVVADESGEILARFCIWCVSLALDVVTGFRVSDQLLDWETKRLAGRPDKWKKANALDVVRRPPKDRSSST